MAVGDSLLFTVRDPGASNDVTVEMLEPRVRDGAVIVDTQVTVSEPTGLGPGAELRFFAQRPDGTFETRFTIAAFPGASFTPEVEFTRDLDRDVFTIGVTASVFDTPVPRTVPEEQTLSVTVDTAELPDSVEPSQPRIEQLFLDVDADTLGPTGSTTTDVSAQLSSGEVTDTVIDVDYSSDDTSVATVSSVGTVFAEGTGTADITATVSTVDGPVSDTEAVTVERSEQPVTVPGQPSDASRVRFPFSIFNAIPGIESAEDFVVTIPQRADIKEVLNTVVPSAQDNASAVTGEISFPEFPDVPSVTDIRVELLAGEPFSTAPTVSQLRDETQAAVDPITTQIDGSILPEGVTVTSLLQDAESTVSDLQTTLDTTVDSSIETADNAFESVQSNLQDSFDTGIETVQGEITTAQTTLDEIQGTAAEFEGVTLPGLQDSVDSITGDLLGEVPDIPTAIDNRVTSLEESLGLTEDTELVFPTVDDFVSSVQDELIPTVTATDGTEVGLLDATPRFISIALEDFLDDALSAATKQRVRERAQEGQ